MLNKGKFNQYDADILALVYYGFISSCHCTLEMLKCR